MLGELRVELAGGAAYPVSLVGPGAADVAGWVRAVAPAGRLIVVADSNVAPLYGRALSEALTAAGRESRLLVFEAGEASKSARVVASLWEGAFEGPVDRGDVVVGVGGGVAGDLAGFVAATLMRGVRFVAVATSTVAMSDAAIGGKTGINLPRGKNLVGAFHHPVGVGLWVSALTTLPERERRGGIAEVVKSAVIAGESEVAALEASSAALAAGEPQALAAAVAMAAGVKCAIVGRDPTEKGERALLNFGHTFGHAIEHASGYGEWTHGEAVAAGMMCALRYGVAQGLTPPDLVGRIERLLATQKLPTVPPSLSLSEWIEPITRDKKRSGSNVKLILCRRLGRCEIVPTPIDEFVAWLGTL